MPVTMRFAVVLGVVALAGCSLLPDHDIDYSKATNLPRMTQLGGEGQGVSDLFPIPEGQAAASVHSGRFVVPQPRPLAISAAAADAAPTAAPEQSVVIATDGNGYPTLNVGGSFDQVWDALDQALRAASVKIDDRNATLALYYIRVPAADGALTPFQLKVSRTVSGYALTLQKDDDTLAPQPIASRLFETLQTKWRTAAGDNDDGKARAALHR